eukprot:scaffold132565_cov17-Tisochrysis_lutea.AAC.1
MARTTYILYACVGLGNSGSCKIYGAYNGQPNTCVKSAHAQHWPAAVPIAIGNAHRANHQNNLKSLWGQINKSPSLLPLISGSEPEGQPQQALQGCAGPAHKELVRCERVDEVQAAAQGTWHEQCLTGIHDAADSLLIRCCWSTAGPHLHIPWRTARTDLLVA